MQGKTESKCEDEESWKNFESISLYLNCEMESMSYISESNSIFYGNKGEGNRREEKEKFIEMEK